ncbi:MAG: hypothetical protein ACI4V0_04870 [Lachnospiraceae bacterium]
MPNDLKVSIFPDSRFEMLTMLYLQNQNLSSCTPEQILDKYDEAYDRIRRHYQDTRADRRKIGWSSDN